MKKILFFTFLTLSIVGCSLQPTLSANLGPVWIMNPNQNGKIGAIGVAARTYDQKISTQRELAITRALDELALQQDVAIEMSMDKHEVQVNDSSSIQVNSSSNYTTNTTLTAHIQEVFKDTTTGEFYVWLVMD